MICVKFPGIDGNVDLKGFEKEIAVSNVAFSSGRGISMEVGSSKDREYSKPSVSEITLQCNLEASSINFFREVTSSQGANEVEVHFVKQSDKKVDLYMTYKLKDVMVSGFSLHSNDGTNTTVNLSFAYTKIDIEYHVRNEKNVNTRNVIATYDIATGEAN